MTSQADAASTLVGEQDYQQLLRWNKNRPARVDACVHSLIAEQCQRRAEAIAVDAWDGKLSYTELDRLSSALAAHLSTLGVGPEVMVPVCFEKSQWVVVAILGIMKAGGAFVLLDESQPLQRMQYVCREVNASIIITSQRFAARGQDLADKVVAVSSESIASLPSSGESWSSPTVTPNNALYTIFTSGSTGQPKGAVIEHGSFSTNCLTYSKQTLLDSTSRVFQFSSLVWDAYLVEIVSPLVMGACVCIPSNEDRMSNMTKPFTDMQANHLHLTPTVARLLDPADLPTLKTLTLTGEVIVKSDVEKWAPQVNLVNAYGPTECTVVTSSRRLSPTSSDPQNVGYAGSATLWIVNPDDHDQLMPVGGVGELLIEGPIVSRGYLNCPDLTALTFVDTPSWRKNLPLAAGSMRFYRTGDLCHFAADGSLQFVGRKDSQIKINGQRVELEEVEQHVKKHFPHAHQVRADYVRRGTDAAGSIDGLLIYISCPSHQEAPVAVSPGSDLANPTARFRDFVSATVKNLREDIPGFMIPGNFVPLCQLPLLPSGKADKKRLQEQLKSLPADKIGQYGTGFTTKRTAETPIEYQLQALWASVLRLPQNSIGADDDFFSLGGRSLDAMQLVTKARNNGLQDIRVSMIFQNPILSVLAKIIDTTRIKEDTTLVTPIESNFTVSDLNPSALGSVQPDQIVSILPVTDFQYSYLQPGLKHYALWKITQPVDKDQFHQAWQTLVNRHAPLRTIYVPHQDSFLQVVLSRMEVQLPYHTVSPEELDAFCASLSQKDNDRPLPAGASYLQGTFVSSGPSQHTFILRSSHAQWDMDTLPRLFAELVDIYHGKDLPTPTMDFSSYMQHRLAHRTNAAYTFWQNHLNGASMTAFNGLRDNDPKRSIVAAFGGIPHPPPMKGLTVASLVKAGWALTLARVTKQQDLVFGHTVNGRDLGIRGLEQVVGCCLNTVPIRVTIQPTWTSRELVEHVQNQYTQTMEYEIIELSDIVKNCTSWPAKTNFGSVVTHDHANVLHVRDLDGSQTSLEPIYPETDESETESFPVQVATESEGTQLSIAIMAFNDTLSQSRTEWLLEKFSETLSDITNATTAPVNLSVYEG